MVRLFYAYLDACIHTPRQTLPFYFETISFFTTFPK